MDPIRTSRELLKTLQNLPPHHRQVFKAFQGQTFLFWHDARWIWFWNATVPVPCIHALRTSHSIQSISCWIEHISGSPHKFRKRMPKSRSQNAMNRATKGWSKDTTPWTLNKAQQPQQILPLSKPIIKWSFFDKIVPKSPTHKTSKTTITHWTPT